MCHAKTNYKNVGMAILISDKVDIRAKNITRIKEGHFLNRKGLINQGQMMILAYPV